MFKKFGFIIPLGGATEIFFHSSECLNGVVPVQGDEVQYSTKEDKNGKTVAGAIENKTQDAQRTVLISPVNPIVGVGAMGGAMGYGTGIYNSPYVPQMPQMPPMPPIPPMAQMPPMPPMAQMPQMPQMTQMTQMTQMPQMPQMTQMSGGYGQSGASKTGSVKFFDDVKGFGFIIPDDGSKEIHFHKKNVTGVVTQDDRVEYDDKTSVDNGKRYAVNVSHPRKRVGELLQDPYNAKRARVMQPHDPVQVMQAYDPYNTYNPYNTAQ